MRQGFIDAETTDEFPERFPLGTSKAQIVRDLRNAGYTVGKELELYERKTGPETGITVTDVHRTGNIAHGFDPKDGYDLRDIDNWTPQQKQKLTRVFNAVKSLAERPFQIYRPRKPENLAVVQKAAQHPRKIPELNVAFVPVGYPGERAEITITKRKQVVIERGKEVIKEKPLVKIQDGAVTKMPTLFSDIGLTMTQVEKMGAVKAAKLLVAEMKKQGATMFTPMAGEREFGRAFNEDALYQEMENIMKDYPRWAVFLIGIIAFDMPKRSDIAGYRISKSRAKRAQTRAAKAASARFRKQIKKAEKRQQRIHKRKKR